MELQHYTMSIHFLKISFKDIMELMPSINYIKCIRVVTRRLLIASLLLSIYLALFEVTKHTDLKRPLMD